MFDKIALICEACKAEFTLYVDDLTASTKNYSPNLLRRIDGVIKQYGYMPHKQAIYTQSQDKVITGVALASQYRATKKTFNKCRESESENVRKGSSQYIDYVDSLNHS